MNGFLNIIKGIFIGAGAIVPGVSSGVLCVIFGIYEKLLDSVLNFFKDMKKNLKLYLKENIFLSLLVYILLLVSFLYFLNNLLHR